MIYASEITERLLRWFQDHGRSLPFRWQKDPFRVLVAGVLLRQTRAVQVASVFPQLMERYSTPKQLAEADEEELRRLFKPLGITSRARSLIDISQRVMDEHGGVVPASYGELVSLPGVGDYVASCVLALGYGRALPMVDTNVIRVLSRVYGSDREIHSLYTSICPNSMEEPFHYAILDLAQLICKHSQPRCEICPLRDICKQFRSVSA